MKIKKIEVKIWVYLINCLEQIKKYMKKKDMEDDINNKIKCLKCETLVDKNVGYCWKCGNQMHSNSEEKIEVTTKIVKEKPTYQYPDLDLIKDDNFRLAIENIPNSGILNIPFGVDNNSNWLYYDIAKMPNLLIGGTVMSGKTNMINSILLSLISKYSNDEIRIVLADSKGVDYLNYKEEPHLLTPVINDVKKLVSILKLEINEMKNRYSLLKESGLKNISSYNKLNEENKIPYHLIFIDDYTSFANSNINGFNIYIEELTKNGWNVGIHLIIVANYPTSDILPSISKVNFPTRISFKVPSIKDSRMILESSGAEKISGIGNALINSNLISELEQIHTNIVEDSDIRAIIKDLSNKNKTQYTFEKRKNLIENGNNDYDDPLYDEIVEFVISTGKTSASLLQTRFRLGYNRAAHLIDLLEERGVIGPQNGSKPREVLVRKNKYEIYDQ